MTNKEIEKLIYENANRLGSHTLVEDGCILDLRYDKEANICDMIIKRSIDKAPYFVRVNRIFDKHGRFVHGRFRKASAFFDKEHWFLHIPLTEGLTVIDENIYSLWETYCKLKISRYIPDEMKSITHIYLQDNNKFRIEVDGFSGNFIVSFICNEDVAYSLSILRNQLLASCDKIVGGIDKRDDADNLFFITCMVKAEKDEKGFFHSGGQRTFGFRKTLRDAEEALNNNTCDMHEYLYDYAVVEEFGPEIHPIAESETWFKWDDEK